MMVPYTSEIPLPKPFEPFPWMLPPHPAYHGIENGVVDCREDLAGDNVTIVVRPTSNARVE
jgi:hypothetical protein